MAKISSMDLNVKAGRFGGRLILFSSGKRARFNRDWFIPIISTLLDEISTVAAVLLHRDTLSRSSLVWSSRLPKIEETKFFYLGLFKNSRSYSKKIQIIHPELTGKTVVLTR